METLAVLAVLDNQDLRLATNYANYERRRLAVHIMQDQHVESRIAAGGHARTVWEETDFAVQVVGWDEADFAIQVVGWDEADC